METYACARRRTILAHPSYGARGAASAIPPHTTLVFEVELLALR